MAVSALLERPLSESCRKSVATGARDVVGVGRSLFASRVRKSLIGGFWSPLFRKLLYHVYCRTRKVINLESPGRRSKSVSPEPVRDLYRNALTRHVGT